PSPKGHSVLHDKVVSTIQEVRARGARTIVIAEEGDESVRPHSDVLIEIPAVSPLLQPIVSTIPLQLFAYELALAKGNDVDRPRNLTKSVTGEERSGPLITAASNASSPSHHLWRCLV